MKICFIADGMSIHTQRWVNYFTGRGHEVHLISSRFTPDYAGYDKRITMHQLVRLFPRIWQVSGYLSGILWLFQVGMLVRRIKPAVVDAHYITVNGYLGAISGFHPFTLTAWGSDVLITPWRSPVHRFFTRYALKRADMVICDSETVQQALIRLGTEPLKINRIYNGVDTTKFSPEKRDNLLRNKLQIAGAPMIISTRNLQPVYNVETIIKAMPLIIKQAPEAKLFIVGDGMQRDYLHNLAGSLKVGESVRFIGRASHDELAKYLASADIYVSTSLSDSTSLSLQEAMACGLPVVVTDLSANREWVTDGKNGYIVPRSDAGAMAEKVVYLIRSATVRKSFGELSRKIIQEKAEYSVEMAKMEEIYEGLARK